MRTPLLLTVGLALAGLVHAAVMPCLWDRDTRAMERQRFPSVLELVTGKFLRHSDEYYRWRVEDRTARLDAGERTPELLDDLAVAHSKLGEDRRAIELMELQEELHPGRYETLANRGTFHVHAGDLEEGARLIERALEVNPDAHFGRERYQLWLVRYAQRRRAMEGAAPLPLHPSSETLGGGDRQNFWGFVAEQEGLDKVFRAAGFEWREPGCSMCLAMNPDRLEGRQISASSSNRNFKGRQGSASGRTLLMSPAMVAAAAIEGSVTDVRCLAPLEG